MPKSKYDPTCDSNLDSREAFEDQPEYDPNELEFQPARHDWNQGELEEYFADYFARHTVQTF